MHKKKKYRKRFSGKRFGTEPVKEYAGTVFVKRKDGTIYPKLTNISVTRHTREFFGILKEIKYKDRIIFDNYDELLMGIMKSIVKSKSLPTSLGIIPVNDEDIRKLEILIRRSEHIIRVREASRNSAKSINRYSRRSTTPSIKKIMSDYEKNLEYDEYAV